MEIIEVIQGSNEWHKARLESFTASEAPAMMGASKHMSRTELLTLKKTGIQAEVSHHTQKIFDKGHKTEALARPIIEHKFMEEFYPVTGFVEIDGLRILASFDGLTMMEDTVFEHKLWNESLAAQVNTGNLPDHYYWQLEQQLMVSGAERAIFVVSDGTEKNMVFSEYYPVPGRKEELIAGWKQFAIDLEVFEPQKADVKHETTEIMALPALSITINGEVSSSNLEVYRSTAIDVIESINTNLSLDEHFAQAEVDIKFCANSEKELESVKKQALSQTADIDLLFKTVDQLKEELRQKRLTLTKLVKSQKEQIRQDIINKADKEFQDHIIRLNMSIQISAMPEMPVGFYDSTKGKRNVSSMRNAVNTELARAKIEANNIAEVIRGNMVYLKSIGGYDCLHIFTNMQQICVKPSEDFNNLVDIRIAKHKEAEAKRLDEEREKIRIQEQQKAEQAERKLAKEREAIRMEEHKKAQAKLEEEQAREAERQRKSQELNDKLHKEALKADIERNNRKQTQEDKPVIDQPIETVTITVSEYNKLVEDSCFLAALKASGVDNWSGYAHAIEETILV